MGGSIFTSGFTSDFIKVGEPVTIFIYTFHTKNLFRL